jgi:hypothetical protein
VSGGHKSRRYAAASAFDAASKTAEPLGVKEGEVGQEDITPFITLF